MHSVVAAYSYTALDVPWSVALSVVLCVGRDFESSKNKKTPNRLRTETPFGQRGPNSHGPRFTQYLTTILR